jgi:glycerol transport system ATP-binding protein
MADIHLEGVAHSYDGGGTWALKPITMTWEHARAYALLGPSGCGKTTLLNIISGLITPTEGRVFFGDRDVTGVPTHARNIAQVFQFPVLYEGMSVYDNLAFPLRNRRYAKADVDQRVRTVSRLLGLDDHLGRRSRRLDSGRKQIVSLGRGLVRSDVAAVLLDEPLTVIDPAMKWTMRSKLKEIHRDTGHTLIYVTHDQTEALTFADEVVVLNEGAVVQTGRPADLFLEPRHEFVGHFIGSPGMNVLPGEVRDGAVAVAEERIGAAVGDDGERLAPGAVHVGVRPEFVTPSAAPATGQAPPGLVARVTKVQRMGAFDLVHATLAGGAADGRVLIAKVPAGGAPEPGSRQFFRFEPGRAFLYRDAVRCGLLTGPDGSDAAAETGPADSAETADTAADVSREGGPA